MADELEELDPDLMFDMPEQQPNGLFGHFADDSLDFQHHALSLSASELGAGFGNIQNSDLSMDHLASSMYHAPFSLADELADAFDASEHHGASRLLAELDHENDPEDRAISSSLQASPLRAAKSSRATIASQPPDDVDIDATNMAFEEETLALHESMKDVKHFQELLESHNNTSANRAADMEMRIETLAGNLIRKVYEAVKKTEDGVTELQALQSELNLAAVWTLPLSSAHNSNDDGALRVGPGNIEGSRTPKNTFPEDTSTRITTQIIVSKEDLLQATADFRIITEELSNSLATILEQVHVNRAAGSDSWRKVRAAETGMGRLKSDLESIQVSQERIIRWEETFLPKQSVIPGLSSPSPKIMASGSLSNSHTATRSNLGSQARMHLLAAQAMLEDATTRARKLLTVQ